ncbi:hypothetical protein [Streptomyces morookaense]|uniref:Uncharacterized protein n=1 Tax=Streptomyces morookaense TaxID=1970 RepID=A0A7Y7B6V8_STRMO|nr:hypothetical protein [Streptomyces morookaense]NVK79975.1 hypothetical protein [Streptomyces morookaense]
MTSVRATAAEPLPSRPAELAPHARDSGPDGPPRAPRPPHRGRAAA